MTPATMPQNMEALRAGRQVWVERAAIRRHIESLPRLEGLEAVCEIIADPGEIWATEKLDRVLRFPHLCGGIFSHRVRAKASDYLPFSTEKQLGTLTERQRERICAVIRGQR